MINALVVGVLVAAAVAVSGWGLAGAGLQSDRLTTPAVTGLSGLAALTEPAVRPELSALTSGRRPAWARWRCRRPRDPSWSVALGLTLLRWFPRWPHRVGALGLVALVVAGLNSTAWAVLVVAATAAGAGRWLRQAARYRQRAVTLAIATLCASVAEQVSTGTLPAQALQQAAREHPQVAQVVLPALNAHRWGAPIAPALQEAARQPGLHALAVVAACWQLCHDQGTSLAPSLRRVGHMVREEQAVQARVQVHSAAPVSTAWILVSLPLLPLTMGQLVGASPVAVLTGTPLGLGCVVAGGGLSAIGLWWVRRLCRRVEHQARNSLAAQCQALAHALAACLQAGATVDVSLQAAASVVDHPQLSQALTQCLRMRRFGAGIGPATAPLQQHPDTAGLAVLLQRCVQMGTQMADAAAAYAQRLADQQREVLGQQIEVLPVKLAGVLGVCFLPAFFLLGIVPLVVALTGTVLPVLTRN